MDNAGLKTSNYLLSLDRRMLTLLSLITGNCGEELEEPDSVEPLLGSYAALSTRRFQNARVCLSAKVDRSRQC